VGISPARRATVKLMRVTGSVEEDADQARVA
jgi:hypothetical protein